MTARHNDTKTVIEATFGGGLVLSEQPITAAEGMDILQQTGVLKQGHFLLTSGLHSDQYLQCALLLQYPWHAEKVCQAMAAPFSGQPIDVVVGPAIGGIVVAYETARVLGVRYMHAERENGVMTFRRGYGLRPGERVLVVEDVVTTGGSVKEVIRLVQEAGSELVGVAAIVDRSGGKADFGVPFHPFLRLDVATYEPHDCPLCRQGIPLEKPGSRQFGQAKQAEAQA